MFVKPCKGRAVRDPKSGVKLDKDGENKPNTTYWQKRIKAGDVEMAKPTTQNKTGGVSK